MTGQGALFGREEGKLSPGSICLTLTWLVRAELGDNGLVTNYGEGVLQDWRGGKVKFYPYEKGGGRKKF